tara:strand:+ start:847 stop:1290 length:444 start_codon:yes stop_codon:yes gene_type:complete
MANPNPRNFPNLRPTSRSFSPGQYPSTEFESLDGTKTHLRFGNKRVNATLTLGFSNISDGEAGLILAHYDDVNSDWDYVRFSTENGALGISDAGSGNFLTKEIIGDDGTGKTRLGLKWRYSQPPRVTSVFPGRSNVSCSFVACLDSP